MSTTFVRMTIAAVLGVAALTTQPTLSAERPARADQEDHQRFPFTFRFDADALTSTKGAERVYLDLKKKAARACTIGASSGSRIRMVDQQCAAELMTAVVQRIASQTLTAQLGDSR